MDKNVQAVRKSPKEETRRIPCEVYSRIVGYLRPTQNWHDGKRQEFADRKTYTLNGKVK